MTATPNPYQSPSETDEHETWWSKVRRLFTRPIVLPSPAFKDGGKIITEGIAFYLDINDSTRLYAASPSTIHTDDRLNLVISEAVRIFPLFVHDNPRLQSSLRGRKMSIRLIKTYADSPTAFEREQTLSWDYVSAVLNDAQASK